MPKNIIDPEKILKSLEKIAKSFPPSSEEYQAVEKAAWAVIRIFEIETMEEFERWIEEGKFAEKQIKHLKKMGFSTLGSKKN